MRLSRSTSIVALGLLAAVLYACTGDDNAATTPPVQEDAGSDGTTTMTAPLPDSGTTPPTDGGQTPIDGATPSPDGGPAPACDTLSGTIVYVESGDTQEALLKTLGRQLRDTANITLVYWLTGSCALTPNLYGGLPIAAGQVMQYIPSTAENPTWTTAQAESTCTIAAPTVPDLGISALYPASCQLGGPDAGSEIGLIQGPIQAYTFIVPPSRFAGDGMAIDAEEAHAAFGASKGTGLVTYNGAPEFDDATQMFFRPTSKSTLVSTAFNIHLTAAVMAQGAVQEAASSGVLGAVIAATSANAVGILGDEVYDTQGRGKVDVLAFKSFGQNHAYFPDSTQTAFDKQNIRDGHYSMWSPTVYITKVDAQNVPTNPAVRYVTDTVTGNPAASPPDGGVAIDGLADVTGVGLTPGCAMQVTRVTPEDGAPISEAASAPTCSCYFLSKIPGATGAPANCATCTSATSCAAGQSCIRGFCEGPGAGVPAVPGDAGGCDTSVLNGCTNAQAIDKSGLIVPDAGL